MASLNGKVAIVTGSSRGIGRAIVERFAQDGAAVVVNYARSADEAHSVVAGIEAKGGKAIAVQADAGVVADIRRLFRETIAKFGHVEIVVNNAGAVLGPLKPLAELTEDEFDSNFDLYGRGPFFVMQEAARAPGWRPNHQHFHRNNRSASSVYRHLRRQQSRDGSVLGGACRRAGPPTNHGEHRVAGRCGNENAARLAQRNGSRN